MARRDTGTTYGVGAGSMRCMPRPADNAANVRSHDCDSGWRIGEVSQHT